MRSRLVSLSPDAVFVHPATLLDKREELGPFDRGPARVDTGCRRLHLGIAQERVCSIQARTRSRGPESYPRDETLSFKRAIEYVREEWSPPERLEAKAPRREPEPDVDPEARFRLARESMVSQLVDGLEKARGEDSVNDLARRVGASYECAPRAQVVRQALRGELSLIDGYADIAEALDCDWEIKLVPRRAA
jgi:hypothetical protein